MKSFIKILFILFFNLTYVYALEVGENSNRINYIYEEDEGTHYATDGLFPTENIEDIDPLEPLNRGIFWFNEGIDYIFIEPVSLAYIEVVPEDLRLKISNILRNLNEPIILINNFLQGDLEGARTTIWRFFFNSLFGLGGFLDVSTSMGIPYKKQDLGLTLACWGIKPGPYLVLPILGPSNIRDAYGRLGDFMGDPINWFTLPLHSTSRTCVQILDAKADNIQIVGDIKNNAIDFYASIQSWYMERRNSLMTSIEDREAIDTPRPEEDTGSIDSPRPEEDTGMDSPRPEEDTGSIDSPRPEEDTGMDSPRPE